MARNIFKEAMRQIDAMFPESKHFFTDVPNYEESLREPDTHWPQDPVDIEPEDP